MAGNNILNVTVYNPTDSLTLGGGINTSGTLQSLGAGNLTISGSVNVGTLTQNNTSGTLTVYQAAGSWGPSEPSAAPPEGPSSWREIPPPAPQSPIILSLRPVST